MFTARHRALAAAGLLIAAVACNNDNSTGPATLSNPSGLTASLNGVDSTFASAQFESFLALTGNLSVASPAAPFARLRALVRGTAPRGANPSSATAYSRALRVLPRAMAGSEAIIPDSVLGTTYVWDTLSQQYVASDSTGAPSNGVRYLLYEVDSTGQIGSPLTQIGHVDFIDLSSGPTTSLETVIASNTFTYADYTVTGSGDSTAFTLTSAGYIQTHLHRLDFSITFSLASGSFSIQEQFTEAADNLSLAFQFNVAATSDTSASVTGAFTFTNGSQTISMTGGGTLTSSVSDIQLTVKVDGNTFAIITAAGDSTSVTDAQGHPLSLPDEIALASAFDTLGHALDWLNDFVTPFIALTGIGAQLAL